MHELGDYVDIYKSRVTLPWQSDLRQNVPEYAV